MATIATLTIDLIGKSAKLTAELKKANKNTKSWADKTRKIVTGATAVMAGFAATGVATYAALYAKNAEFIDQQAKTADRLGLTTQALAGLQHAADLTGASTEALNMGLQRMTRRIGQVAATGKGEAKVALDQLGISIDDIASRSPDEQFKLIADRLSDVADQGQKVFLTQKLFDSEGVKLLNTLDAGSAGIAAMMQEAEQLGIAVNRVDAAKIEIANDELDRARKLASSFGRALAIETAPIVAALSESFVEAGKEAGGFGNIAVEVVSSVAKGFGYLANLGRLLKLTFMSISQGIYETINGALQGVNWIAQLGGDFAEKLGFDATGVQKLQNYTNAFDMQTKILRSSLKSLANEEMPLTEIEDWLADVRAKFDAAAKRQFQEPVIKADKILPISNPVLLASVRTLHKQLSAAKTPAAGEDPDKARNQSLVENARNQYQQIFDAQLEMEGKVIQLADVRYQRKVAEMQAEFDLLKEKNLVTAQIETEFRTAKEQAHAQHLETLSGLETDNQAIMKQGYNSLLDATASYFDGVGTKRANYAKTAIKIGQTLMDEEKRNSIASIWAATYETAMKAYKALAAIPVIGPVLGAGAAGAVIAAGGLYAGKVAGIASYDGGGYTGDGPRIGGIDGKGGMAAIVHPKETIYDHTKGQSPAMGGNIYNIHMATDEPKPQSWYNREAQKYLTAVEFEERRTG